MGIVAYLKNTTKEIHEFFNGEIPDWCGTEQDRTKRYKLICPKVVYIEALLEQEKIKHE
jgi:hypothetical protein